MFSYTENHKNTMLESIIWSQKICKVKSINHQKYQWGLIFPHLPLRHPWWNLIFVFVTGLGMELLSHRWWLVFNFCLSMGTLSVLSWYRLCAFSHSLSEFICACLTCYVRKTLFPQCSPYSVSLTISISSLVATPYTKWNVFYGYIPFWTDCTTAAVNFSEWNIDLLYSRMP